MSALQMCLLYTELIHCTTSFHLTEVFTKVKNDHRSKWIMNYFIMNYFIYFTSEVVTFLNRCHRFSRANCNDLPCLRRTLNQFHNFFRKLNFLHLFLCIKHSILVRRCNGRQWWGRRRWLIFRWWFEFLYKQSLGFRQYGGDSGR